MVTLSLLLLILASEGAEPCEGKEAGHVLSERSDSLGNGFKVVRREVCNDPELWEAIGHFDFLQFKDRELGRVGQRSVSPSGRYALFESAGKLLLFDAKDQSLRNVTDGAFAIPKLVKCDEKRETVTVTYYENHAPSAIGLSK